MTAPETLAARLLAYADGNSLVIPTAARLLLLEAVAALTAPDRVGWQPIASAPKDGSDVLLTDGSWVRIGDWGPHGKYRRNPMKIGQLFSHFERAWSQPRPTHWRPLPAPPAIEAGEHGGSHAE